MDWQSWDVTEFAGKHAMIETVDGHSGGWGHINVDHLFQSNRVMESSPALAPFSSRLPQSPPRHGYTAVTPNGPTLKPTCAHGSH